MPKEYGLPCPVAQTLDIVGDRWTLLIVRDLVNEGARKYSEFAASLQGIAPNILSERLKLLEEHGIVEREFYEDHPPRARYKLTRKGGDLSVVLQALAQWGNKHRYDGVAIVHEACGHDVKLVSRCDHCDQTVGRRDIRREFRTPEARAAAAIE